MYNKNTFYSRQQFRETEMLFVCFFFLAGLVFEINVDERASKQVFH